MQVKSLNFFDNVTTTCCNFKSPLKTNSNSSYQRAQKKNIKSKKPKDHDDDNAYARFVE